MAKPTRARRAARIRAQEGLPEGECLYDTGYESTDCDCELCDRGEEEGPFAGYDPRDD